MKYSKVKDETDRNSITFFPCHGKGHESHCNKSGVESMPLFYNPGTEICKAQIFN